ncbi:MAG: fibronectin type III domain-containing protein [Eubacteriales bacterium]|nr:fibronectin type III domain-containing protein [Eubacteriales bacterium]
MKKLLMSVVSFCLLAVFVPTVKADAAAQPVAGNIGIGSTVTVTPGRDKVEWYRMDLKAGQSYYFYTTGDKPLDLPVYDKADDEEANRVAWIDVNKNSGETYYAVKDETWYFRIENNNWKQMGGQSIYKKIYVVERRFSSKEELEEAGFTEKDVSEQEQVFTETEESDGTDTSGAVTQEPDYKTIYVVRKEYEEGELPEGIKEEEIVRTYQKDHWEPTYGTDSSIENKTFSVAAGQTFTGTVTKEDSRGDNVYFYKPEVSGEYTFKVETTDSESDVWLSVGKAKKGDSIGLSSRSRKSSSRFGYHEMTVSLQAGAMYRIGVGSDYVDTPYTLSMVNAQAEQEAKKAQEAQAAQAAQKAQEAAVKKVTAKKVKVKKAVSPAARTMRVTWKKVSGANGYEVSYSLKKNMKKAKTKTVSAKKPSALIKKLKKGKKYYVKVRAFKKVGDVKHYGKFSKTMKVRVK